MKRPESVPLLSHFSDIFFVNGTNYKVFAVVGIIAWELRPQQVLPLKGFKLPGNAKEAKVKVSIK